MGENNYHWLNVVKTFRDNANNLVPIVFFSTVNGYHHFRYTPAVGQRLSARRETDNPHDPMAVLVYGDRPVGRVPRGLASVISENIDTGRLVRCSICYTGQMQHDGIRRGGGPKLVCVYLLEFRQNINLPQISSIIRQHVDENSMFL